VEVVKYAYITEYALPAKTAKEVRYVNTIKLNLDARIVVAVKYAHMDD